MGQFWAVCWGQIPLLLCCWLSREQRFRWDKQSFGVGLVELDIVVAALTESRCCCVWCVWVSLDFASLCSSAFGHTWRNIGAQWLWVLDLDNWWERARYVNGFGQIVILIVVSWTNRRNITKVVGGAGCETKSCANNFAVF